MIFFDTNVLVYATINQGDDKLALSEKSIEVAMDDGTFFISPLVFSEYVFILAKLKLIDKHDADILFYSKFIVGHIDALLVLDAYRLCKEFSFCKNINDLIHLKIAEQHCRKIVTFDSDFKRLQQYSDIEIEILK